MNTSGHIHVDVIIVGAGIAGASLAAILKNSSVTCALIEANLANKEQGIDGQICTDPRALAITIASKNILQLIGAWDEIPKDHLGCFRKMYVWDENGLGEVNFDSADLYEPVMGYIVEQRIIEQALESALNKSDHVNWYRPVEDGDRSTAILDVPIHVRKLRTE